jgi:guanine deaminase
MNASANFVHCQNMCGMSWKLICVVVFITMVFCGSVVQSFYLATLGGATSLGLDDKIGNFKTGKEADFAVISWDATPLSKLRAQSSKNIQDKLFVLLTLGDDRNIFATYVVGRKVYHAD